MAGVEELVAVDHKDETERKDDIVADIVADVVVAVVAGVENDQGRRWRRKRGMRGNRHLEEAVGADGPA